MFGAKYKDDLPRFAGLEEELEQWELKWEKIQEKQHSIPRGRDAQTTLKCTARHFFCNIFYLLVILCVLPVTTCSCERCMSALRRIKTSLRSTGGERFSGLTLLSIYRDVEVDLEAVIDIFASKDNWRVNFTHPDLTFKPDTY